MRRGKFNHFRSMIHCQQQKPRFSNKHRRDFLLIPSVDEFPEASSQTLFISFDPLIQVLDDVVPIL